MTITLLFLSIIALWAINQFCKSLCEHNINKKERLNNPPPDKNFPYSFEVKDHTLTSKIFRFRVGKIKLTETFLEWLKLYNIERSSFNAVPITAGLTKRGDLKMVVRIGFKDPNHALLFKMTWL